MCKVKAPNMGAFRNRLGVHEGLPVARGAELGMIRSGRDEVAVRSRCDGVVQTIAPDGEVFTDDLLYMVVDPGPIVPGLPPRAGAGPDAGVRAAAAPMRAGASRGESVPTTTAATVFVAASGDKYHRAGCTYLTRGTRAVAEDEVAATHTPCSRCMAADA